MNLSIWKRPLLAIKQWLFGALPPKVSPTVNGMIDLLDAVPEDMALEFERSVNGAPSAVYLRYNGPLKWLDGNLQAVRIRLTASGMWLDMPDQERVELNWLEMELLQEAVDAWVMKG